MNPTTYSVCFPFRLQGNFPSPWRNSASSLLAQSPNPLSNASSLPSSAVEQESLLLLPILQCFALQGEMGDGFCQDAGPAPNFFFLIYTQHRVVSSAGERQKHRVRPVGQREPRAQANAILPLFAQQPHPRGLPHLHRRG